VGADSEADSVAEELGLYRVTHPPENPKNRAYCVADETHPLKPYTVRDHDIVDASQILVACSKAMHEIQRSGTWATVRYAQKRKRPVLVVWPDGTVGTLWYGAVGTKLH